MFPSELFCRAVWLVLAELINILAHHKDAEFFNRNLQKNNDIYFKTTLKSEAKSML